MIYKFPQLYKHAADLLKIASEEDKNVKHLLYSERKYQFLNIKSLYAIVTNALKRWDVVETLIKESNILTEHPRLDIWRIRVIITELIFDKKKLQNHENNTIQTVTQYEEKFNEILSKEQTKNLIKSNSGSEWDIPKVRFVKMNTIQEDVNSVIEKFQEEGWERLETGVSYEDYLQQLRGLKPSSQVFLQDFHIPEVLVFPQGTELQDHELYRIGAIFFMDKASCLAPLLLAPHRDSHVLDMCAAPGLKTIQLASYVPKGKVYAVERDAERYKILQQMVGQSGADNVTTLHQDVTRLDIDQYKHVEHILVDPSCTGSGIRGRQPSVSLKARMDEETRLKKLSGFQLTLLRFALTRFPAAKRVVYSTCSLNVEENEQVVEAALSSYYHNFDVVSVQDKLPGWISFGSKGFQFGHKCVYSQPQTDCTNGFFVAVFERSENKPEISCLSSVNHKEKSKNLIKQGNKRSWEENNNDGNESFEIYPHKRVKLEFNETDQSKENKKIIIYSSGKTEAENLIPSGKKLTRSEKKRRRQSRLKKTLLSQLSKEKNPKDKKKNHVSNEFMEKTDKNKSDNKIEKTDKSKSNKKVLTCHSETKDKIPKAKLRKKRMKLLKSALASKSNTSKTVSSSSVSSDLKIMQGSEGNTDVGDAPLDKKKEKRKSNNLEQVIEINENKVKTKKLRHKMKTVESTETSTKSADNGDENKIKAHLENMNINENEDIHKVKRKKKHAAENIENDSAKNFHLEESYNKDGCVHETNEKTVISLKNEIEGGKSHKKKHKKTYSLENMENNTEKHFHLEERDDKDGNAHVIYKKAIEIISTHNESEEVKSHKKKHAKKASEDNIKSNTEKHFYLEESDDKDGNLSVAIPINNESEEGKLQRKKHKKKHSEDNLKSTIEKDLHSGESDDKDSNINVINQKAKETFSMNNDSEEEKPHKKKHKKKHSKENTKSNSEKDLHLEESDDNNVNSYVVNKEIKENISMDNESQEGKPHKKKHKKKHSEDNIKSTTEMDFHLRGSVDKDSNINVINKKGKETISINNESVAGKSHKKNHKKKHLKTT